MKQRVSKLWVVYAKTEDGIWDEIDFSLHFRNLKWILRANRRSNVVREHGYTTFIFARIHTASIWMYNRPRPYKEFFNPKRVKELLGLSETQQARLRPELPVTQQ